MTTHNDPNVNYGMYEADRIAARKSHYPDKIALRGLIKKNTPLFACLECGKKFYSVASADRAAFGDNGCPGCGGSDIDIYLESRAQ